MVRRLLLSLALAGWGAACGSFPDAERIASDPDHGDLTCVACHDGEAVNGRLPDVPAATCSSAECHRSDNPAVVALSTVEFEHRGHGSTGDIPIGCAGCHTHDEGAEPLVSDEGSCALCHREEMSGQNVADCLTCHTGSAEAFTSQGIAVPHEERSWISNDCVRCHFDVVAANQQVPISTCSACHTDRETAVREGVGDDLHPSHTGVTCNSCHEEDVHQILAQSSAVALQCTDCHADSHGPGLPETIFGAEVCNACHVTEHRAEQGLLLGLVEGHPGDVPSEKFMDGVTCRSCHVSAPGADRPVAGSEAGCTGCHRAEYSTVLDWWEEGVAQRWTLAERYVARAESDLRSRGDSAVAMVSTARSWLTTIDEASGVHNLELSHRLLADAIDRVREAYGVAGLSAPAAPGLGREPRSGLCSYCHYTLGATTVTTEMDSVFHREVLGVGR